MKAPVRCTRCGKDRYPRGAHATPYICRRCLDTTVAVKPAPAVASAPRGDPFHNDLARREAINGASARAPRWLARRPGWLRKG